MISKPFYLAISLTKSPSCRQILPKLFTFCRHVGIFRANFAFIARFSTFLVFWVCLLINLRVNTYIL
jgi:hypothetical protein